MDIWNPAKVWKGSEHQACSYCREYIRPGEWSKQNATTGKIFHDLCAEQIGAYGPDFAIGGIYGR